MIAAVVLSRGVACDKTPREARSGAFGKGNSLRKADEVQTPGNVRSAEMRAFPSARERLLRSFGLMLKSSDGRRRQRPFIATMAPR
jgi:hypothetical protein